MYRTNNCGELRLKDVSKEVKLSGWVFRIRPFGGIIFIDLRDRYGVTQLVFDEQYNADLCKKAQSLGREYVISARGVVRERSNKNPSIPTGDIEILVDDFEILNKSEIPPFTLENETDGGDELRMRYRYLDLRRECVKANIILRHQVAQQVRNFLNNEGFLEIETPFLIKSTPEGARDFVVPSRLNQGCFYALPQSPQTFKQLLMVAGFDKYYQIVRCFRDEDLRADRQPEFTQIDCEVSFHTRDQIINIFENLIKHVFKTIKNIELPDFQRITYKDAIEKYGSDKPDLRFGMEIHNITEVVKNKGFQVFDNAEYVCCIAVEGGSNFSRKQIDELTEFVRQPQIGASGLVWAKWQSENEVKSSVDKFFNAEQIKQWFNKVNARTGDMLLILAGNKLHTLKAMGLLRLFVADKLKLRQPDVFKPLWVIDFPLLEWSEEDKRFYAVHHPFTSPVEEDEEKLDVNPAEVRANAYDLVINGVEVGGGSIRIHNVELQKKMFSMLGLSEKEAENKFGFLINAFKYGAPPHGGIAFGFDRLVALLGGSETIRDFIAFPKNNQGRDVMLDAPSEITEEQLKELGICLINNKK